MKVPMPQIVFTLRAGVSVSTAMTRSQDQHAEALGGPDSHETGQGPHGPTCLANGTAKGCACWNAESASISSTSATPYGTPTAGSGTVSPAGTVSVELSISISGS